MLPQTYTIVVDFLFLRYITILGAERRAGDLTISTGRASDGLEPGTFREEGQCITPRVKNKVRSSLGSRIIYSRDIFLQINLEVGLRQLDAASNVHYCCWFFCF